MMRQYLEMIHSVQIQKKIDSCMAHFFHKATWAQNFEDLMFKLVNLLAD